MPALTLKETGDSLCVSLSVAKMLDDATTQEIGEELMGLVDRAKNDDRKMVVDLQSVQFISSAMIGKLILLNKAAKTGQVVLKFRNVLPDVMKVFRVMRLDKVLQFEAEESSVGNTVA